MKTKDKEVVVSNYYSRVIPFLPAIVVFLLGLPVALLVNPGAWPTTVGVALMFVVVIAAANSKNYRDVVSRKFFGNLGFWAFFLPAALLAVGLFFATHAKFWLS